MFTLSYFDDGDFSYIDDSDGILEEFLENRQELIDKNRKYCQFCLSQNCIKCTGCQCDCKSDK